MKCTFTFNYISLYTEIALYMFVIGNRKLFKINEHFVLNVQIFFEK